MDTSANIEKRLSSTERTAWKIAARHLARGQKDPVQMIVEAIREERSRCIALLRSAGGLDVALPPYLADPDFEW